WRCYAQEFPAMPVLYNPSHARLLIRYPRGRMAVLVDAISADQAQSNTRRKTRPTRPLGRLARSSRLLDAVVGKFLDAIAATLAGRNFSSLFPDRRSFVLDQRPRAGTPMACRRWP